jgi:hypothetical protein
MRALKTMRRDFAEFFQLLHPLTSYALLRVAASVPRRAKATTTVCPPRRRHQDLRYRWPPSGVVAGGTWGPITQGMPARRHSGSRTGAMACGPDP